MLKDLSPPLATRAVFAIMCLVVRWDDAAHIAVNALAALMFLAAVLWVFTPAGRDTRPPGLRWTIVWLLPLALSVYVDGFFIPVGVLVILWIREEARPRFAVGRHSAPDNPRGGRGPL